MNRKFISVFGAILCALAAFVGPVSGGGRSGETLRSFYIAIHGFSDFLPAWYQAILDVEPDEGNLRIRLIEITAASYTCGGTLVRARECVIPNLAIRKLVGRTNPCDFTAQEVEAALKSEKPKYAGTLEENHTLDIVATCGTSQRVLSFPYTIEVDLKALHRENPRIDQLWSLDEKVRDRAFGKNFRFAELPDSQDDTFKDLAIALLPELRSGKFDAGFDDPCSGANCGPSFLVKLLQGYTGPPNNPDPSYVELEDPSSLDLAKYVAPKFPQIAKTAHILGEVRLRLIADPQTGAITNVQVMSGNPILGHGAVAATNQWRFVPRSGLDGGVDVRLKYHLCGN